MRRQTRKAHTYTILGLLVAIIGTIGGAAFWQYEVADTTAQSHAPASKPAGGDMRLEVDDSSDISRYTDDSRISPQSGSPSPQTAHTPQTTANTSPAGSSFQPQSN